MENDSEVIVLRVEGMMCQKNCGTTVCNALKNAVERENTEVIVSFPLGAALVKGTNLDSRELIEAVEMMGFDACEEVLDPRSLEEQLRRNSSQAVLLRIEGMMCQKNCGTTVHSALSAVAGVEEVIVSHSLSAAMVMGVGLDVNGLVDCVEAVGFDTREITDRSTKRNLEAQLKGSQAELTPRAEPQVAEADFLLQVPLQHLRKAEIQISGMSCAACVANVERNLPKRQGIHKAAVALISEKASVEYDPSQVSGADIAAAVDSLGYRAKVIEENLPCDQDLSGVGTLLLHVQDMDINELIEILRNTDGVTSVDFDEVGYLRIKHYTERAGARDLYEQVMEHAWKCRLAPTDAAGQSRTRKKDGAEYYRSMFFGSLVFTIPVVFLSMVCPYIPMFMVHLNKAVGHIGIRWHSLLLWVLSTPVQFYFGAQFYRNAYNALSHGSANMDVLVALGTSSAYLYSMVSLLIAISRHKVSLESSQDAHFFETSATLITFILLGKYLEAAARKRTASAITALMDLQVESAILVNWEDRTERVIDLRLVQIGDVLKVLPGQRVPVDGVVVLGSSSVDESMLTGEAAPVVKKDGDPLTGSTVNGNGVLFMRATRVGSDTALAQIMRLVEDAQTCKAPIQEYADRIAKYFVPLVVLLALLTWISWGLVVSAIKPPPSYLQGLSESELIVFAFKFGIAVLVISCPCALGLATPTAVMVSTGVGAQLGILIKGGDAIEQGANVTAVVFDKTGTITKGTPKVVESLNFMSETVSEASFWSFVASAEQGSEHPVAKAILQHATSRRFECNLEVQHFEAVPGFGVNCTLSGGTRVIVGNRKHMRNHGVELSSPVEAFLRENEKHGTVVCAAVQFVGSSDDEKLQLLGAVAVCDPINENASYAISMLRALGVEVFMLSGDNEVTALAVAEQSGIPASNVFANCLPKQKSTRIARLQKEGCKVAMVGDGINDSPALTLADLGIAIGAGTDIAMKSADVVLIRSCLLDVPVFLHLARRTIERIKLNFFFSFVYNLLCIPLAAGIFYPSFHMRLPPTVAGFMMAMSSVSVVCSSLLLKRYKPPSMLQVEFGSRRKNSFLSRLSFSSDLPNFDFSSDVELTKASRWKPSYKRVDAEDRDKSLLSHDEAEPISMSIV